jgi:hypothetical protein
VFETFLKLFLILPSNTDDLLLQVADEVSSHVSLALIQEEEGEIGLEDLSMIPTSPPMSDVGTH